MKKLFLIFVIAFAINPSVYSQTTEDLYLSKEFKQAYDKGTRTIDGEAGANYFVNKIDYNIKVEFIPDTRLVNGSEVITYHNNSGDTLDRMYLNLYMNLLKKGNARDWDVGNTSDISDGVKLKKVVVANQEYTDKEYRQSSSILSFKLKQKIPPHTTCKLQIDWEYTFPEKVTIRNGQYGDKNFFIAYWYPKITVYDDIVGWNTKGHTGMQEFYNDFGDYKVEITVPGDYSVWSTAILQNPEELYTQKYIDKINESKTSDSIIHIISEADRKKGHILKKSKQKVWKFKSENTPDFAFAISRSYLWDATSVQSGDRRISVNSAYKKTSRDFKDVAQIAKDVIAFYTDSMPGIAYPYPQFTAFNGGGGMEFPGMVNCGDSYNLDATRYLIAHELGHSYFPFYTGLNEQKYAWMDEGLITFFPKIFVERTSQDPQYNMAQRTVSGYNRYGNSFLNVPLIIPSDDISAVAYRYQAYTRSSMAFFELYKLIGEEKFSEGLQLFTERWKGKHPIPFDLFYTFNQVAGEDLAWFWKPWFFEMGAADLAIGEVNIQDGIAKVTIKNLGAFPVSIRLKAVYSDQSTKDYNFSSRIWKDKNSYIIDVDSNHLEHLILDTKTSADVSPENNIKEDF